MVKLISFGFKHGPCPADATHVFNCTTIRNPYHSSLRSRTGKDLMVQNFCMADPKFGELVDEALIRTKIHKVIAFGCVGGHHRSVAAVEIVARRLREAGHDVEVLHREL